MSTVNGGPIMSADLKLTVNTARSLGYIIPNANTLYALDTFITSLKTLSALRPKEL